jgi:hypothetical protein
LRRTSLPGETDVCNDIGEFTASETGALEVVIRGASDRGIGLYEFAVRPG